MEVLKGEKLIWNDKGIFLGHNASHCLLPVLLHLAAQVIFSFFFSSFLFHLNDFSYNGQILHELQM